MKSLAACTIVLALAACSSSPGGTTSSSGTSTGGATGGKSTGTTGTASGGHGASSTAAGSSTGSPLGMHCTYDANTGDDSCTDEGYECTAEFSTASPATCVLPQDLAVCDGDVNGDVGCQDGGIANGEDGGSGDLFCSPGFENANNPMLDLCLYPCGTTSDCAFAIQSCITQLGGCFDNTCGRDPNTGAFVGPYFGTCPVLSTGDGQCLSFNTQQYALCFQNGTANPGEPCNPIFRFGADSECTYGNYCQSNAGGDGGLCFPIAPIDGGACPAGDDPVSVQTGADWAICAQDCTTSMSCDGGVVGTSCQALTGGATASSVCLP